MTTHREASKKAWAIRTELTATLEEINAGSLQRIADAAEAMAKRYTELIDQRNWFEGRAAAYSKGLAIEKKRTAALRGVINAMKRKAIGAQP